MGLLFKILLLLLGSVSSGCVLSLVTLGYYERSVMKHPEWYYRVIGLFLLSVYFWSIYFML